MSPIFYGPHTDADKRRDLAQRLRFLYGDHIARLTSLETQEDLMRWRRLGRRGIR